MPDIFISYRREDTSGYAGRLYDQLSAYFGREHVFMDVAAIEPGSDFVEAIEKRVGTCDALIAVIGKDWLTIRDELNRVRLGSQEDFVTVEVAAALKRSVEVIPVLVGGAKMPLQRELPESLQLLSRRQALAISDVRFTRDVTDLIETLERPARKWTKPALVAAICAIAVGIGIWIWQSSLHPRQPVKAPVVTSNSSPGANTIPLRPNPGGPNISGKWRTAPFRNVYSPDERSTIVFDFTQSGDTVMGTVTETVRNVYSSENAGQTDTIGILEGKIRDTVVSFYTKGELTDNTVYKEMYTGVLQKDGREIAFQRIDDLPTGGLVERFVARPK
jgi:TIR domain-containing protein